MNLTFADVRALDAGVWTGALAAADAAALPGAPLRIAGPHVLVLDRPLWNGMVLTAAFHGVSVVALGTTGRAIYLANGAGARVGEGAAPVESAKDERAALVPRDPRPAKLSSDDEMFVYGLDEIGSDMARVGRALMARIRQIYPGALQRTDNPRRFVETPDNFWGVEVQPRKQAVKLTVRADEAKLKAAGLPYQLERPPSYFAIKIQNDGDVEMALKFLAHADRG